ncbi:MAG: preprotein translocase subunit SecE [Anaerolineaceae bacterium]|nr:preprotein translocase subunit SecE [Anaerolineaceae bacterium]
MADKRKSTKKRNAIQRWWRETIGELRKVVWPTPPEAWRLTKIVIIVIISVGAFLGLLDFLFSNLIELIII